MKLLNNYRGFRGFFWLLIIIELSNVIAVVMKTWIFVCLTWTGVIFVLSMWNDASKLLSLGKSSRVGSGSVVSSQIWSEKCSSWSICIHSELYWCIPYSDMPPHSQPVASKVVRDTQHFPLGVYSLIQPTLHLSCSSSFCLVQKFLLMNNLHFLLTS